MDGTCQLGDERTKLCYNFVVWDYVVFGMLFVISGGIGLFFAIKSRNKTSDADDYLLAGRQFSAFPVSLSLTASFMSAITVLGTPAEFYIYGTMFWWFGVAYTMVAIVVSEIYIPVFYRLGITSTYEYLEIRFSRPVRLLGTTIYMLNTILYIGICIYAPALALNEVTGLGVWWSAALTALVCMFYTSLGGMKAVVWTDVFQCLVMWIGFIAVIIRGSVVMGGFDKIWSIASDGGRIEYNKFQANPTIRHTFWTVTVGGTFLWTGTYGTTQSMVQRYLSCKSENHARGAIFLNVIGLYIILILTGFSGLTMYAYYASCDPYSQGWVQATDQLMPYFVLELLRDYPGLPGIYVCSAFSGTLSTVSTGINAMATVTTEDYIRPIKELTPRQSVILSKILVLVYGVVCMGMAVLASQLGGVLEAALSVNGLVGGAMVGLFTLGMLLPWSNSYGAFIGTLVGLGVATWPYVGSTIYPPSADKKGILPLCTTGCNTTAHESCGLSDEIATTPAWNDFTTAADATTTEPPPPPPIATFYAVSYLYYPIIGFCTTVVVGLIVSFLTGYQKPSELPPGTICAFFDHPVFCWLPKKVRKFLWCGVRHEEKGNNVVEISTKDYGNNSKPKKENYEKYTYNPYADPDQFSLQNNEKDDKSFEAQQNGYTNKALSLPSDDLSIMSTKM